MNYYAAEIYIGNWDWPANNMKCWGNQQNRLVKNGNGLLMIWIWLSKKNTLSIFGLAIFIEIQKISSHTIQDGFFILDKLMENQQFRIDFFNRFLEIIDHFSPKHFNIIADYEINQI